MVAFSQDAVMGLSNHSQAASKASIANNRMTLRTAAALLHHLNLKDYEWTEQERPLIAHNQFDYAQLIPLIDMSPFTYPSRYGDKDRAAVAANMAYASSHWGFFQVINHGVDFGMLQRMEKNARGFFDLDLDQKKKILRQGNSFKPMGYACGAIGTNLKSDLPWMESLQLPCVAAEMEPYASKVWQDGNKEFREEAAKFSNQTQKLTESIMRILMEHLATQKGGSVEEVKRSMRERMAGVVQNCKNSVIRFNHYPPCPIPSKTLGLGAHSDPHLLTLLYQDNVGGLQICHQGQWITVKPRPNSFVVNIGDAFQVWSNDVYKSVEHRSVCNAHSARLSMAFFLNPVDEAIITPLTRDPPLYRQFTWKEYRECMYTHRPRGKSNIIRFAISTPK